MKYVYGPVPSRRLGRSLGIDPIPKKSCNWNCVYCQLGATNRFVRKRQRYVESTRILTELQEKLAELPREEIDWITVVGSGEPTLYAELGAIIAGAKRITDIPVGVITNGSLLSLPEVRQELLAAEAVMPTLDAGNRELFLRINRPARSSTFERQVAGLEEFRLVYRGKLWVEVMLISGLNDTDTALRQIAERLAAVQPDQIHLSRPERPPAEPWVRPSTPERTLRAVEILGEVATILPPTMGDVCFSGSDLEEAVLEVIARHPLPESEVERNLRRLDPESVGAVMNALRRSRRLKVVYYHDIPFWTSSR